MAYDRKYGRVTLENSTIGEDEPVVVFRAQDKLLPQVLDFYATLCGAAGSPENHINMVGLARRYVAAWQEDHHTQVPTSERHP